MFRNDRTVYRFNPYNEKDVIVGVSPSSSSLSPVSSIQRGPHQLHHMMINCDPNLVHLVADDDASSPPSYAAAIGGGESPIRSGSTSTEPSVSSSSTAPAPPCALGVEEDDLSSFSSSSSSSSSSTRAICRPPLRMDSDSVVALSSKQHHFQLAAPFLGPKPILGFSFPERSSSNGRGGQTALIHVSFAYASAALSLNRCGFLNDTHDRTHQACNFVAQTAMDCYSHWARARSVAGDLSRRGNRCPNHAITVEPAGNRSKNSSSMKLTNNSKFHRYNEAISMSFEQFLNSEPMLAAIPRREDFIPNLPYDDNHHQQGASFHENCFIAVYDRVFGLSHQGGIITHTFDGESTPSTLDFQNFRVPQVSQCEVGALLGGGTRGVTLFVGQMDPAKFHVTVSLMNQTLALAGTQSDSQQQQQQQQQPYW